MSAPTLLGNSNQQKEVLTIHYWKLGLFFLLGGLYIPLHSYYFSNTQALDREALFAMIVITIISLSLILSKKEVVLDRARRKIFRNTLFSTWEANFNDIRNISIAVSESHSNSWCVLLDTNTESGFELLCFHSEELIQLLAEALGEETCVIPKELADDSAHPL